MRKIEADLDSVLWAVNTAEQHGHNTDAFQDFAWMLMGKQLSDQEIESFARSIEAMDGCGEEDYEGTVETLREFRSVAAKTTTVWR